MTQEVQIGSPDALPEPHSELLEYVYDWYELQLGELHREALEEAVDETDIPVTIKYDRDYQPIRSWTGVVGYEVVDESVTVSIDRPQGTETHEIAANWREVPDEITPFGPPVVVFDEDDDEDEEERLPEINLNNRDGLLSNVTEQCPGCGTEFDEDSWEKDAVGGDFGGVCHYYCSTEGCDGQATFDW